MGLHASELSEAEWAKQAQAKPPKTEQHHLALRQHHTNTGVRPVEVYQLHEAGLYVSRSFVKHPRIRAWQAHLLPELGLQVCRYDFHGPREHDYYIDLATITAVGGVWEMRDHYLDVLVWQGARAELVDADEWQAARRAGYLSGAQAQRVMTQAQSLLERPGRAPLRPQGLSGRPGREAGVGGAGRAGAGRVGLAFPSIRPLVYWLPVSLPQSAQCCARQRSLLL